MLLDSTQMRGNSRHCMISRFGSANTPTATTRMLAAR
jgi:hypothetical protein